MSKYRIFLITIFIIALVLSAINPPAGRDDWLLENIPIFMAMAIFIFSFNHLKFSNFSATLLIIYLLFPLTASHFGVTGVPLGKIIGDIMGTTRNMYDRLTHFMFGFLCYYPAWELVKNINKRENIWNYYIPLETIFALSAIYEIFEWLAAITVNPVLAASFYGSQGDIFDTPKDMATAAVGAIIAMVLTYLYNRYKNRNLEEAQQY